MPVTKWTALSSETTLATTTLNSIANGSRSSLIAFTNSTNNRYAMLTLELGSCSPSLDRTIIFHVHYRRAVGVNEDMVASKQFHSWLVPSGASTKRVIVPMVQLPASIVGFAIENQIGVTLPASGNALNIRTYDVESV